MESSKGAHTYIAVRNARHGVKQRCTHLYSSKECKAWSQAKVHTYIAVRNARHGVKQRCTLI